MWEMTWKLVIGTSLIPRHECVVSDVTTSEVLTSLEQNSTDRHIDIDSTYRQTEMQTDRHRRQSNIIDIYIIKQFETKRNTRCVKKTMHGNRIFIFIKY